MPSSRLSNRENRTLDEKHFGIPSPDGDDFGDDWWHTITLEKILPTDSSLKYPVCVDGKRTCPPEDCGGVRGHYRLLKITNNPKHKEYKDLFEWLGGEYDSEYFVPDEVEFSNPKNRLRKLLTSLR